MHPRSKNSTSSSYRTFDKPDQQAKFENGTIDLVAIEDQEIGRVTFESGWRYSEGQQQTHVGIITRGTMHIQDEDGSDNEVGEGTVVCLRPGMDAWTDGPCEFLDLTAPHEFLTGTS